MYDKEHLLHSMSLSAKTFPNDKVWDDWIVKMEYYLADCTENLYYHQRFVCAKPFWVVLIKMAWIERHFFSIMAFQTHPLIPWNSTNSIALSKVQFFSSDYMWNHISHVIISSQSNKSVNKYFINDLRQKKHKI